MRPVHRGRPRLPSFNPLALFGSAGGSPQLLTGTLSSGALA